MLNTLIFETRPGNWLLARLEASGYSLVRSDWLAEQQCGMPKRVAPAGLEATTGAEDNGDKPESDSIVALDDPLRESLQRGYTFSVTTDIAHELLLVTCYSPEAVKVAEVPGLPERAIETILQSAGVALAKERRIMTHVE